MSSSFEKRLKNLKHILSPYNDVSVTARLERMGVWWVTGPEVTVSR